MADGSVKTGDTHQFTVANCFFGKSVAVWQIAAQVRFLHSPRFHLVIWGCPVAQVAGLLKEIVSLFIVLAG